MQKKILLNLIIVSLSGILLTTIVLFAIQTSMAHDASDKSFSVRLSDVEERIRSNTQQIEELTEATKEDYISRARALAMMVDLNPEIIFDQGKLLNIADALNVDEVYIIDEDGILKWGSVSVDFGMDFASTDQTRPFLAILEDPAVEIAQDPMPNGSRGLVRQYAGVSLRNKKGIAQIGMVPERLEEALKNNHISNVLSGVRIGNNGYVFSMKPDTGIITSHPNKNLIGKKLDEPLGASGFANIDGERVRYGTRISEGELLAAVIPTSELYQERKFYTLFFFVFMIMIFGAFGFSLSVYMRESIVAGILETVDTLEKISSGNLNVVANVSGCEEFVKLSDGINHMLSSMKAKIAEIASMAGDSARLGAIVAIADAGIIVKDTDGVVREWNIGAENILGYKPEEIIGETTKYYASESGHAGIDEIEKRLKAGESILRVDVVRKHKNGHTVDCSASYTPIFDENGSFTGSVAVFHDISDKKQMEYALEAAVVAAQEASDVKSVFLANMSHEIRTPMNAVIGMADLLLSEELSHGQRKLASDIKASGTSLLGIINNILDLSKIEAGKFEIVPVDYDFISMLENTDSIFAFIAQSKNIEYKSEKSGNLPYALYGDDIRLKQVLTNLLSNAVKFTAQGYVKLKTWADADSIFFDVSDTGTGIRREDIGKLFDAFQQFDLGVNRAKSGTGLGLSISKSIIEAIGGDISVESEYGKGSVFHVRIPLIPGDPNKIQLPPETYSFISAPDADVLVVDDFDTNLNVASGLLRLLGIECDTALDGAEAIELIKKKNYDIVFMDHMMPGMDGIETTRLIRGLGFDKNNYPIIALTANAIAGVRELLIESGMNDFLSKPIDKVLLNEMLIKWLPPEKVYISGDKDALEKAESAAYDETMRRLRKTGALDVDSGLALMGGSEKIYKDTIRIIVKRLPELAEAMSGYLKDGTLDRFTIDIHGTKSSLASMGATELSKRASELEARANSADADFCNQAFPGFSKDLLALYDKLRPIVLSLEENELSEQEDDKDLHI